MSTETRQNPDSAWAGFGQMLQAVNERAHTAAMSRASRAAEAEAAGSSTPAVYGALFTAAFRNAYEEACGQALVEHLPW
jgi:hypothetical protein